MATGNFMAPGRVSPAQQKAGDDAAAAKNIRGSVAFNPHKQEAAQAAAHKLRSGYSGQNVAGVASNSNPTSSNSDNVEKKTVKADKTPEEQFQAQDQQVVVDSGIRNILNGYRSITYSFTLAVLDNENVSDPESYRNSELKYVILKSGGKGKNAVSGAARAAVLAGKARTDFAAKDPRRVDLAPEDKINKFEDLTDYGINLVSQFNRESPGAFDMFIDNINIDTIMTTNETSNSTLPTKIKFDVFEPYSINGFIEALYIASLAAGYESYLDACFLLKMEFWGYPDDVDLPEPELIQGTERYFPFGFVEVNVDVTESGTRYQCGAVPYNERVFGQSNVIKKPIKMEGATVGEILENLFKNINAQVKESDDKSKDPKPKSYDNYSIVFPTRATTGELTASPSNKSIKNKKLTEILKDNALYAMNRPENTSKPNGYQADNAKKPTPDQNAKAPESIKYEPGKTVINFQQGMNINDAIASVVRDSDFVKDMLKDMGKKPNVPDQFGFIEYFIIIVQVTNQDLVDPQTKRRYQNYIYNVVPYKVHYTRVPGYGQTEIKEETYKQLSARTYNYIYTGQNVDVLSFKLNFNTLFFEAVPTEMGNKDTVGSKSSAAPGGNAEVKVNNYSSANDAPKDRRITSQVPQSPVKAIPTPVKANTGGNAGQQQNDPYSVLAKHMHEAVVNSKASMITGEMEILGDPYYLATGGVGNYNPKSGTSRGVTKDGEADQNYGSVLITINFRNPLDINSFEDGGMAKFDSNRVPFSGVYQVLQVSSTFKDGLFKQKLEIMRMPGQVLDTNLRDRDPADMRVTNPDPTDQVIPDNTRSVSPTERMDSTTVMEQLDRGLPSPGLPDQLSNFTAAAGGLGGDTPSLLNQTAGQVAVANSIMRGGYGSGMNNPSLLNGSAITGQPLPNPGDISSNIRLQSSGLINLNQSQKSLGSASLIAAASNVLTGNLSSERAIGSIGGSLINSAISAASKISNIGSGIGKGATLSISPNDAITLPAGSISSPIGASSIGSNSLDAVKNIGNNSNSIISGIGNKIDALNASPSDPLSIAAKVGIDPSKLSGLGGALQSKIPDQLTKMISNIPDDVNLQQASSAGLVLDYIPASKMANIPATPPHSTAPVAAADVEYAKSVVKRGGLTALENLYGVNNYASISASLVPDELISAAKNNVPNNKLNPYDNVSNNSVDTTVMSDKLATAKSQLSGVTGQLNIPDANSLGSFAGKFGSNSSVTTSPLNDLMNRLKVKDPNAPPYTGTDPIIRARLGLPPLN